MNCPKLSLGTVQFGLDYGISNREGKTSRDEAVKILELALKSGVEIIDTAHLYGESESIIGLSGFAEKFQIVTKTPHFINNEITDKELLELNLAFESSLKKLKIKPYGLLIHNADDLLKSGGEKLFDEIKLFKQQGKVLKIGVSVYSPMQCKEIIERFKFDLIQLPMNIYDQRFLKTGLLDVLNDIGVEIHVRSVFLQGLLLMEELPNQFKKIQEHHIVFQALCEKLGLSQLSLAMNFVSSLYQVDKLVLGVNNLEQLKQIILSYSPDIEVAMFDDLSIESDYIINPSKW